MGRSNISIFNKTGYSMFWGSMWDNRILYSRFLKEDIFVKSFFLLIFNDSLSSNLLTLKKKNVDNLKKNYQQLNNKNILLKNFFFLKNKTDYYQSKVWLLKYQQWVILYNFVFISNFDKKSDSHLNKSNKLFFKNDLSTIFNFYKKSNFVSKKNFKIINFS